MRSWLALTAAALLGLNACGVVKSQESLVKSGSTVTITGQEANKFTTALLTAGLPRKLMDLNYAFVIATKVECQVSGATSGQPACTLSQFDGDLQATGDVASSLYEVLSAHAERKGSAHAGVVSVSVTDVRCSFNQMGTSSDIKCTFVN